ncbi:MFS transporter [Ginsengibacter hankyongi]|uniref:MFS transporter n=1 Tax=Ginsengibacter hankyongi TaxID=2607284 RepID=A0A5J5IDF0_9BACT|nr:MFS transporter [Ginsengibacter hankyongi]KAA9036550.1 MFS transporter [Ginsengibacter hankyongi]
MEPIAINKNQPSMNSAVVPSQERYHLAAAFIICFISIMFSGIASMLMSVYLPVVVRDLLGNVTEEKMNNVGAYINSVFIFGSMFGGFAWGFICDKIGRAKAVIFSTALFGLFTVLTALSSSWLVVGIYRFITGFGVGGVIVTTNILIAELWPEKKRAVALGIVSAAMPIGFIAAGAMNNILSDWHMAFLTGFVPIAVAIIAILVLPESSSWKSNKHKPGINNNLSDKLFAPGHKKNLVTGSVVFGTMLIGLWAVFSWAPTWIQSITGDDAKAKDLRGLTMMILAISGLVGSIVSGWIANAIGLRKTMMMCFAACFIMTFVVFKLNTAVSSSTFIEMGILAFFFGISQGALSVYIPHLFPTVIRASATGFCFNIGRLFTATVVFFIGALVSFLGGYGNAVFIFSFIFLIGLATTYFSKYQTKAEAAALNTAFAE